jgi:hypothetical protein
MDIALSGRTSGSRDTGSCVLSVKGVDAQDLVNADTMVRQECSRLSTSGDPVEVIVYPLLDNVVGLVKMKDGAGPNKMGWLWLAPEYFSRWRIFPRAFITMYIYLLFQSANWFMGLEDPTVAQSGLISVLVGAGAAWFGLYVNSTSTQHDIVAKD